jgi:hypothetical protein
MSELSHKNQRISSKIEGRPSGPEITWAGWADSSMVDLCSKLCGKAISAVIFLAIFTPALGSLHPASKLPKYAKIVNPNHVSHSKTALHKVGSSHHPLGNNLRNHANVKHQLAAKESPADSKVVNHMEGHKVKSESSRLTKIAHSSIPLHKDGVAIQNPAKWAGFNPRHASEVLEV